MNTDLLATKVCIGPQQLFVSPGISIQVFFSKGDSPFHRGAIPLGQPHLCGSPFRVEAKGCPYDWKHGFLLGKSSTNGGFF